MNVYLLDLLVLFVACCECGSGEGVGSWPQGQDSSVGWISWRFSHNSSHWTVPSECYCLSSLVRIQ